MVALMKNEVKHERRIILNKRYIYEHQKTLAKVRYDFNNLLSSYHSGCHCYSHYRSEDDPSLSSQQL